MISMEGILTVLLLANIIYLNFYLFDNRMFANPDNNKSAYSSPLSPSTQPTKIPTPCADCITPAISAVVTKTNQAPSQIIQNAVKDYYISFGSGTTQAGDWTDVPGVQAVIDFGQYPHIKEIHFEVSLYVPTANEWISVRLYNETDNHPVWNSQVTMSSGTTAYLTSPAINYDTGSKLYQVQMETQLGSEATLVQSRIHIMLH
jgi:hypothetical protein